MARRRPEAQSRRPWSRRVKLRSPAAVDLYGGRASAIGQHRCRVAPHRGRKIAFHAQPSVIIRTHRKLTGTQGPAQGVVTSFCCELAENISAATRNCTVGFSPNVLRRGSLIFRETTGRLARADSQVASTTYKYLDWRYMFHVILDSRRNPILRANQSHI